MAYNENSMKGIIMEMLDAIEKADAIDVRHRFAKVIVGVVAGFIAAELAKNAYTKFVIERNNETPETE